MNNEPYMLYVVIFYFARFLLFIPACFRELCVIFVKSIYSRKFAFSSYVTRTS